MRNVTLWDSDNIESHNICNQAFPIDAIGHNKAEVMKDICHNISGAKYESKPHWNGESLDGLIFSCVDSMDIRKKLLNKSRGTFIETRMGVYHGQIFTINPRSRKDKKFWMDRWVGDDVVEEKSACGTSLTIGSTANLLSSVAAWQGIYILRGDKPSRLLTVSVNPPLMMEE